MQTDQEEFLRLIEENKRIIFKICNSYCYNKNDHDDLAQEIVCQLWKSCGKFDTEYKFSTWMYRIALNTAISFYRKEKKSAPTVPLTEHLLHVEDNDGGTGILEAKINSLHQFINELKALDRALMILYLEEKNYSEIAEILGITETNVATKISRIKEKLKQKFLTINY